MDVLALRARVARPTVTAEELEETPREPSGRFWLTRT
jgi:hypothetical protein